MDGANLQIPQSENIIQKQPEQLQQPEQVLQQQQLQQPQEAEPKYFDWQGRDAYYNSFTSKSQKKNYKFKVMDDKKLEDILNSENYKKNTDAYSAITNKKSALRFQGQREVKDNLFDMNASILKKDKKSWWRKDSTKMADIKIALDRIQTLMHTDFHKNPTFVTADGKLNFEKIAAALKEEFQKAIDFCDAYLSDKKKQGNGSTAKRRRERVEACKKMLVDEQNSYRILSQPDIGLAIMGDQSKIHTPRDMMMGIKVIEVGKATHQNQGNSQEVYVVDVNKTDVEGRLVEGQNKNGEKVQYYMKENLPTLDKYTDLYLERRISELKKGKEYKNDPVRQSKEEYRMKKSGTDDTDYENGITFLETALAELTKGDAAKQAKAKEDFCNFLSHDFDSIFRSYEEYKRIIKNKKKVDMVQLQEEAKVDPIKGFLYLALVKQAQGQDVQPTNIFQWLVETKIINFDPKNPLYKILENISKQDPTTMDGKEANRLEVLLRVTTGKEAELYGQMTARAKGGTDMSQYLTMMTSEMGSLYKFDVLCKTYMAVTDFGRWDESQASGSVVTLQESAPGMEWIELQKKAMKEGKPVKLSPNAARQLISLQVIDTISAQVDRHGRNFKCETEEVNGEYVVKSIKAYDHDMSFSEVTLKDSFVPEIDQATGQLKKLKKNGFLPPMMQKISPASPLFRHIRKNYLHLEPDHGYLDDIKQSTFVDEKGNTVPIPAYAKDSLLTVFYETSLSYKLRLDGEKKKIKKPDYYNVVNKPSDIFENSKIHDNSYIHSVAQRTKDGKKIDINISKELFKATPQWAKNSKQLNEMSYEDFAKKMDDETAESLGIATENKNQDQILAETNAIKAVWKLSRIISELGRIMVPAGVNGQDYLYDGPSRTGDDYNLFKSSQVFKRTDKGDDKDLVEYTQQERERIIQLGKQLKDLNEKWDFSGLYVNGKTAAGDDVQGNARRAKRIVLYHCPPKDTMISGYLDIPQQGFFDGYIQSTLEYIATMFKDDPVVTKIDQTIPDELKEFLDNDGNIELPSVLHMDIEDYKRAQNILDDFDNNSLKTRMRARQLSEASIEAAHERARETVAQIKKMERLAEKLLQYKYPKLWEENKNKNKNEWDPKLKFFLTADEFGKLEKLSDLAIDPGDTYLVQDDDDYMSTQEEYRKCLTQTEQENAKDRREKAYLDQKRWMGTKEPGENFKSNKSSVDIELWTKPKKLPQNPAA